MKVPSVHLPQGRVVTAAAIGMLVGVVGVGAVTAASPSPSGGPAATSPTTQTAPGLGARPAIRRLIGHNFRVELNATNQSGSRDFLYVRGTIQIASGTLTVTLPNNSTQVFSIDSATIVRDKGQTIDISSLENGQRAMAFGLRNADGSYTAKLIRLVKPSRQPGNAAASPSATP